MNILKSNQWHFLMFLIFTAFLSIGSSPIPSLQDYHYNRRSSSLPAEDKGRLSQHNQLDTLRTLQPPSAIGNLAQAKKDQGDFRQASSDTTKTVAAKQSFMQLGASGESTDVGPSLTSLPNQQNSNGLSSPSAAKRSWELLPLKPNQQTDTQLQRGNISPPPVVPSPDSKHAMNSVLSSKTQQVQQSKLPLRHGKNVINFGRIELKTDWCTPIHFKETIKHHGCKSVSVDNNMCYGQCNSFYIPKHLVSCSYCTASKVETMNVRLECPGQNPDFIVKKVAIVKECSCKDCEPSGWNTFIKSSRGHGAMEKKNQSLPNIVNAV